MPNDFAQHLDFANHKANATPQDIDTLCAHVAEQGFHAAFVNATYIAQAKKHGVRVGTVVSFPLGQDTVNAKAAAANEAVTLGADELDVVPNLGTFLAGNQNDFVHEMKTIVDSARMVGRPVIVKFILEPGYLTPEQIATVATCIIQSGADFIKIGSGMGPRNPTREDVQIVAKAIPSGSTIKIKVAGGVTNYTTAKAFVDAGVTRIGTSHALEIITGAA